jgi:CheY-like chemotaxis protein
LKNVELLLYQPLWVFILFEDFMMDRILIVEDERSIRWLISTLLRKRGYEIVEAVNGLEALRTLECSAPFDIVVTDMQMPRLGGMKLIQAVKLNYPNLYVIAMSTDQNSLDDAQGVGADSSIHKTFTSHSLVDVIDDLCRKHLSERAAPAPL